MIIEKMRFISRCIFFSLHVIRIQGHFVTTPYTRGNGVSPDRPGLALRCGRVCSQRSGCFGFLLEGDACLPQDMPLDCPSLPSPCYMRSDRPPCAAAMRTNYATETSGAIFVLHQTTPTLGAEQRFDLIGALDIAGNLNLGKASVATKFGALAGLVTDYYTARTPGSPDQYLYMLYTDTLDIYHTQTSTWSRVDAVSGVPLRAEYGAAAPSAVDAAELDFWTWTLYLVSGDTVYTFRAAGDPPYMNYAFVNTFDFTTNSFTNPFSAGIGSELQQPPGDIHGLTITSDEVIVFSGLNVYVMTRSTSHWIYAGSITCDILAGFLLH